MIITAGRRAEQLCWSQPRTRFSAPRGGRWTGGGGRMSPAVSMRWCRRRGRQAPADPGGGAGAGGGAEAGEAGADRRPGPADLAADRGVGAVGPDAAAAVRAAGAQRPGPRAGGAAGVRPVRMRAAERDVDRGHPARPGHRRGQVLPFRVPRRPLPRRDGGPVGLSRQRGPDGGGVPPRPAAARRPPGHLPGQRQPVRRRVAAARLRRPRHQAHPFPAGEAGGKREDRAVLQDSAGPVPGRDRRRGPDRRPGRDEPAVPGLGRNRLPPGGSLRDRRAPIARWARAAPAERAVPGPGRLREAFLWSERRKATKTALVSLHGNSYQVDPALAGRYVELVFDPFDLASVEVRAGGKPAGTAVPFTVGRHRHPKTRTRDDQRRDEPPRPGSITSPPSATRTTPAEGAGRLPVPHRRRPARTGKGDDHD